VGDYFCTSGRLLKLTNVAQISGLPFAVENIRTYLFLIKFGLGYMLGDFLINSSGHPGNLKDMISSSRSTREWTSKKLEKGRRGKTACSLDRIQDPILRL
jgi:hypothetical protein